MLPAKLFLFTQDDGRGAERTPLSTAATMRDETHIPVPAIIRDLSATGARLECDRALKIGQRIRVGISGAGVLEATVVHRTDGYGCIFDRLLTQNELGAAETANTVVPFGGQEPARRIMLEPDVSPYPRWMRLGLLLAISLGGWWLILRLLGRI